MLQARLHVHMKLRGIPLGFLHVLTIGTLSNLRTEGIRLDGAGIGLSVTESGPNGFFGVWRGWGSVVDGEGYFCSMPQDPLEGRSGNP